MFTHNIIIAWRNIRKYLMQNIISVIGLTASLISFCIIMHFVRYFTEMYDTVENHDRIVSIYWDGVPSYLGCSEGKKLKSLQLNTLSDVCTVVMFALRKGYVEGNTGKNLPYQLVATETDASFAAIFDPHIVAGSWEQVVKHPNSLVLNASQARRIFGSEAEAVGQCLNQFGSDYEYHTYTVRAVMEDWSEQKLQAVCGSNGKFDMLCVNDQDGCIANPERYSTHTFTYGLMADGCSVEDVNRELLTVLTHFPLVDGIERGDMAMKAHLMGERREGDIVWPLYVVIGIALLVLSVGLFNFLHFLIGTFLNRTHEYSLRRLMGCRWRDLFLMLMTQMAMMVIAVGWLCNYVLRWLDVRAIVPEGLVGIGVNRGKLMLEAAEYTGWIFLLCTFICLVISWRIHRMTIQRGILGNTAAPRHQRRMSRNLLLGFQFFSCWLFVSLTVGIYMQTDMIRNVTLNTLTNDEKSQILAVSLNPVDIPLSEQETSLLCQRLEAHSGVKELLLYQLSLLSQGGGMQLSEEPDAEFGSYYASYAVVPSNYFDFLEVELVRGTFPRHQNEVVVDRKFAERFSEEVVGKTFYIPYWREKHFRVTGVVDNINANNGQKNEGTLYEYKSFNMSDCVYLKCYPEQVEAVRGFVRQELRQVFPENIEPEIRTLMQEIEKQHKTEIGLQQLTQFFSIVSLVIALLGVYSTITLDTERRRKEVAIRKVFGARFGNILWMFGRRYFWLLVIPALLAFPIDYLILHWFRMNYVEFINIGPLFWLGIFLGVSLLVVLTILWRILQVAHVRPAEEIAKG